MLEAIAEPYNQVTSRGVFRAASIKAVSPAKAAEVCEGGKRNINIAFVNEITQIVANMDPSVWDMLAPAGIK